MELQEFYKQKHRMCENQGRCVDCPIHSKNYDCEYFINKNPKKAEEIVQKWSEEHPIVTNADKFKEIFGKPIGSYGAPCPQAFTVYEIGAMSNVEWLNQEYKEPQKESD